MSGASPLEVYLARLYADPAELARFLSAPEEAIAAASLGPDDAEALRSADRVGLVLAARSYQRKREGRRASQGPTVDRG